jgi:hypothetical protein
MAASFDEGFEAIQGLAARCGQSLRAITDFNRHAKKVATADETAQTPMQDQGPEIPKPQETEKSDRLGV